MRLSEKGMPRFFMILSKRTASGASKRRALEGGGCRDRGGIGGHHDFSSEIVQSFPFAESAPFESLLYFFIGDKVFPFAVPEIVERGAAVTAGSSKSTSFLEMEN